VQGGDRRRAPARPKNGGVPSTARPSHLGGRASGTWPDTEKEIEVRRKEIEFGTQGSLARNPIPIVRPTGCASELPGPGRAATNCTPSAPRDPSPDDAGQKTVRRSRRAGRDEGGSRTLRRSAGGCTNRLGAAGTRGTMWKTASASPPPGGRPRLVADHTHKRTLHKDRKGGDLFLFTHLIVERCPFLFI